MSLADELLADLEDDYDEELENLINNAAGARGDLGAALDAAASTIDEVTEDEVESKNAENLSLYDRISDVAKLKYSPHFKEIMEKIHIEINQESMDVDQKNGNLGDENDPEYRLIVEANNLTVEIDNELNVVHKFVRDKYAKRFPELESLVPMPLEYIACVKELGNEILDKAKNSEQLQKILLPATVIVVSVTASTTQGQILTPEELEIVEEACDVAEEINDAKIRIYHFVESRMTKVAPNLCRLVGAATAAKLMGVAGGLRQLSKMPSCNILVLGAQKNTLSGFSSTAVLPHTGFVYYTPLIQSLPPDLRKKAARLLAGKCTLAARIDACRSGPNVTDDGQEGARLFGEIMKKYDKLQEPPPQKQTKALPKPLDQASKKRGGRRIRKMKERLGLTDMRHKAHRMTFGDIQEDVFQDHLGLTLGQMKNGGNTPGGRIRAAQVDQKSRARMSQKLQRSLQRENAAALAALGGAVPPTTAAVTAGGSTSVSSRKHAPGGGTVSTVTFTPVQGLEISNPTANSEKMSAAAANAKYFGTTSTFVKVQGASSTTGVKTSG
uniref:U4/U6 small nuclear ribonucleoprotein Prp31 n=1 Tax=Romanomermis culicivorax TaxID=13658 RepID=A0A915JPX6_ROMCU